jgi:hypothetical protein
MNKVAGLDFRRAVTVGTLQCLSLPSLRDLDFLFASYPALNEALG